MHEWFRSQTCVIWTGPIMQVHPCCFPPTIHLLAATRYILMRLYKEDCNAINKCPNFVWQKPHSYRWPIASVMAHWWSLRTIWWWWTSLLLQQGDILHKGKEGAVKWILTLILAFSTLISVNKCWLPVGSGSVLYTKKSVILLSGSS